jgi:type I restriction enzyme S subunit
LRHLPQIAPLRFHLETTGPFRVPEYKGSVVQNQIARVPADRAQELKRHRVESGDLIFARRGELSHCACLTDQETGWLCGTGCLLMRFDLAQMAPQWLALMYRHDIGQRQVARMAVGTTMVNLNTAVLSNVRFGFPPKDEQDAIVRVLSDVSNVVRHEDMMRGKLNLLRSGLMSDLLTGRVRVPESILAVEAHV